MFGWPANPSVSQIQIDYPSIKDRLTQRTLTTRENPKIKDSLSYGQQMANTNRSFVGRNSPPRHYYKNWKKDL